MEIGREALRPKRLLELRKVGPGKSWIGRSKAIELIQDHYIFPACNPGHWNWQSSTMAKRQLELRKLGPRKSWIVRSKAIELIQDLFSFQLAIQDMEIGPAALWPKQLLELRKVGPGKSWIGRSKAIELIQDHHFLPACNPAHGKWPSSSMAKTAIRSEKSGSWEVLDW